MNNSEKKICQNCKKEFIIDVQDFEFYQKINVPPPTFCPECRMIRRMIIRNERSLYKGKCNLCGKDIISMYPKDNFYTVYCQKCWWSDKWDGIDYGREYDFSRPFLSQFYDLLRGIPRWNLVITNSINSEYSNFIVDCKDCYLSNSTLISENIINSNQVDRSKDCLDCLNLQDSELTYQSINSRKIFKSSFLLNCRECIDSAFLFDCVNCQNCFMSSNLRNKSYVIRNKQHNKEDYMRFMETIPFGSYQFILQLLKEFLEAIRHSLYRYVVITKIVNSTGDYLTNCKNAKLCFYGYDLENVKHSYRAFQIKDSMDINFLKGERMYEACSASLASSFQKFSYEAFDSYDIEYCIRLKSCSHIFGCVGLRHKEYCILNKQYTKEEYEELVPKIIEQMNSMPYIDKKGRVYRYGEFFPSELSPFCYNETIAQEYFTLTKEQAIEQGYRWKEPEQRDIKIDIKTEELPDHIKDVKDDIIGKIIQCANANLQGLHPCNSEFSNCTTAFKIIPQELEFYRKMNLPLPRLCPNCRHFQRIKQRNPLKLWHRKCMCGGGQTPLNGGYQNTIEHFHGSDLCPNEFQTTYSSDRPEIVYCEKCYLSEVV